MADSTIDLAGEEKVRAARAKAAFQRPYFAHALYALVLRQTSECPTMGVDQWARCYWNPTFVHACSIDELATVFIHEISHLLRHHHQRANALGVTIATHKIANYAQDCFPAGTVLADGLPIEAPRTRTIGGSGGDTACTNLVREWNDEVVTLKAAGIELTSTPEHPHRIYRRRHKVGLTPVRLKEPAWIQAQDARVGDFLLVPNIGGDVSDAVIDASMFGGDENRSPLKSGFPLNAQTAWLLGLYTAEGSGAEYAQLSLGFSNKERAIADRAATVARSLGYEGSVDEAHTDNIDTTRATGLRVRLGGPVLARALKTWCGDGAYSKRCPEFVLRHHDLSIVRAFLEGLAAGDGHDDNRPKTKTTHVDTSSRALAAHVRLLLARLGLGFWGRIWTQKDRTIGNRFLVGGATMYQVGWTWNPRTTTRVLNGKLVASWSRSWRRCAEGILIPIKKIERSHHVGPVYNLTCDEQHTFITEGVCTHNCEINDDLRAELNERKDMPQLPPGAWYPEMIGCPEDQVWEVYYAHMMDHIEKLAKDLGLDGDGDGGDQESGGDCASGDKSGPPQKGAGKSQGSKGKNGKQPSPGGDGGARNRRHQCGSGADGVKRKWEDGDPSRTGTDGVSDADWRDVERHVAQSIREQEEKSRGTVPGHWVEWADNVLRPERIPWDVELAGALRWAMNDVAGMVLHSYRRPSRRQNAVPEVVLPTMRRPVPRVAIVGDTSGSMSGDDLALVRGTVSDICAALGATVIFIATDADVHGIQNVQDGRNAEMRGRGGTDMRVGIECALTDVRPKPDVIVVLSDCETPWPEEDPGTRVVIGAIRTNDHALSNCPEWARVIRINPADGGAS